MYLIPLGQGDQYYGHVYVEDTLPPQESGQHSIRHYPPVGSDAPTQAGVSVVRPMELGGKWSAIMAPLLAVIIAPSIP